MSESREAIPEAIQRELRAEAGYGCCLCGDPIIDYHHIREYAVAVAAGDAPHVVEDMMVVCPTHHRLITNGSIDEATQRKAKAKPRNIKAGFAQGRLFIGDRALLLSVGSARIEHWFAYAVDDVLLLALTKDEAGRVEVTLRVHDEAGAEFAAIVKNQWVSRVGAQSCDVKFIGRRLNVRRFTGELALEVDASQAPSHAVALRGALRYKGGFLEIGRNTMSFGSTTTRLNNPAGFQGIGIRVTSSTQQVSFETNAAKILRF